MLKKLYDWMMEKAGHAHAERWLFLFSFVESSFFPIPPHPLLGLMCLARPDKALRFGVVCTLASVMGGLFGYAIGYFAYETIGIALLKALGLWDSFPAAACYLREFGAEIILIKGATPIPFKLITLTAGFIKMDCLPSSGPASSAVRFNSCWLVSCSGNSDGRLKRSSTNIWHG